MASLEQSLEQGHLLRVLVLGQPKTKKTWWSGTAAEAGFNVIYLNVEKEPAVLKNLSPAARQRIQVINIQDTPTRPIAGMFMTMFLKGKSFVWDEQLKTQVLVNPTEGHTFLEVDINKLTPNDVLVLDSYTALCWSVAMTAATENEIDLSDASKPEWDFYGYEGRLLTWMVEQLTMLPCHVIVIGHNKTYEKYKGKGKERELVESYMILQSSSNPHGETLGIHFSDILKMERRGASIQINTGSDGKDIGGCENLPPQKVMWEQLPFSRIADVVGATPPPPDAGPSQAFIEHTHETVPLKTVGGGLGNLLSQPEQETRQIPTEGSTGFANLSAKKE